ncbi:hypothetical protein DDZ13_08225 [Coraliomargarita sinensis]|uniref:DUF3800 domain-containing protein n=1 Tax=Coraliomargarita sinensis TaxID=2174842 RepID=A0A317ZGJ6_9BACT|nr:DUF3800 domain-containing protein [Coraliomargarita sinensis]PXA04022.1 hypothetical protein DDZ13_08225 [Coraliomargarita sinensis]
MKVCYCDETGIGTEPIGVMVGIVVDSSRMHVTKEHWGGLLAELSRIVGRPLQELHTHQFYAGSGVWKNLDGPDRAEVISVIFEWLEARKHHVVYTAVLKGKYEESLKAGLLPKELGSLWRFMGCHIILSMQRAYQTEPKKKGNTIFVFDNEHREMVDFIDLIKNPPAWCDTYYNKKKKQNQLDQIIDVPYFGDSKDVALIQLADFVAFFIRRYAEIKENLVPPKYTDEKEKINSWAKYISKRSIGRTSIFPKVGRCSCADYFFDHAPESIRNL